MAKSEGWRDALSDLDVKVEKTTQSRDLTTVKVNPAGPFQAYAEHQMCVNLQHNLHLAGALILSPMEKQLVYNALGMYAEARAQELNIFKLEREVEAREKLREAAKDFQTKQENK